MGGRGEDSGRGEEGAGKRKQDANEPALINVCLISHSALSGQGKRVPGRGRAGEEGGCWGAGGRIWGDSVGRSS